MKVSEGQEPAFFRMQKELVARKFQTM